EVLWVDHGLIRADDCVNILEKNDPRHDRMRKARLLRFLVVLAKIAGGMEELARRDRRMQLDAIRGDDEGVAANAGCTQALPAPKLKCFRRCRQAAISAFEEQPHIRWDDGIGETLRCWFAAFRQQSCVST